MEARIHPDQEDEHGVVYGESHGVYQEDGRNKEVDVFYTREETQEDEIHVGRLTPLIHVSAVLEVIDPGEKSELEKSYRCIGFCSLISCFFFFFYLY